MRVKTGVEGFDELIEGGLLPGRQYLVSGSPGSGKTTFGTQFLSTGAMAGEVGIYITLSEQVDTIVSDMSRYSFNVPGLIKLKKLVFIDMGPNKEYGLYDDVSKVITPNCEMQSCESAETLAPSPFEVFKAIDACVKKYEAKRLVVDSLSSIRFFADNPAQEEKSVSRFVRNLKNLGCTTILLSELTNPDAYTVEQFASHGVIFLHNFLDDRKGKMTRTIQVLKMRGTKHDCDMRTVTFTDKGLKVL